MTPVPDPVALPAPGQPLDRGATSLGLALLTYTVLLEIPLGLALVIGCATQGGLGALGMVLTIARVWADGVAGHRLASDPYGARGAVRTAVIIGVAHALSIGLLVGLELAPFVVATLCAFPLGLAVVVRSLRLGTITTTTLRGEPAVVGTLAAVCGLFTLAGLVGFIAYLAAAGSHAKDPATIGFTFAIFAIGSLLLVRVAAVGPNGTAVARAIRLVEHYAWIAGGLVLLAVTLLTFGIGVVFAVPLAIALALLRFCQGLAERQTDAIDPEVSRGAARLTIGWLLLGQGLLTVTHPLLPATTDGAEALLFLAGGWATGGVWLHAAIGALEIWVAAELLAGTRRARPLAAVWAVAVIVVLVQGWFEAWRAAEEVLDDHWRGDDGAGRVALVSSYTWMLLVFPAVTLATLRRPYTALTARARRRA